MYKGTTIARTEIMNKLSSDTLARIPLNQSDTLDFRFDQANQLPVLILVARKPNKITGENLQ